MTKVKVLEATRNPMQVISSAAGCCYGKDDYSDKRVLNCFKRGHMSVFEHASATFEVADISRACSHQLVRHRIASYSQRSQRYTKLDYGNLREADWYVIPPDILEDEFHLNRYKNTMYDALIEYLRSLDEGVKPEDARMLLPEATKTDIVCTMNLREIYHFLDLRWTKQAQWEIRDVAEKLYGQLSGLDGWDALMAVWKSKSDSYEVANLVTESLHDVYSRRVRS